MNEQDHAVERVARALRIAGAVLLIASASTFLLQQWERGNDLLRFGFLVAHSVVLTLGAWVSGARVRESRGARTFLGVVLALLPVQAAVAGGLLYSQFALDGARITVPAAVTWVAPDPLTAVLTVAGALAILAPLALVAFTTLARQEARGLFVRYVALNGLFLLPVRDSTFIGPLAAFAALLVAEHDIRTLSQRSSLRTPEGTVVRALLFAPVALLAGRTLALYEPGRVFVGACLLALGAILWRLGRRASSVGAAVSLGLAGLAAAVGGAAALVEPCRLALGLPEELRIPLLGYPAAALMAAASSDIRRGQRPLSGAACVLAALTATTSLVTPDGAITTLLGVAAGLAILAYAAGARSVFAGLVGFGTALAALVAHVRLSIVVEAFSNWGSLLVLGVVAILGGAVFERSRHRIAAWLERMPKDAS